MAINVTDRKATFTGNSRDVAYTVPLECENTSDVEAYAAGGAQYRNGVDYTVTNNTIPGVSSNTITLTFATAPGAGTITVYRTSDRTQTVDIQSQFTNDLIENALDRITLAAQNTLSVSGNAWDLNGGKISYAGEPTEDTDASTLRYLQETRSKDGYVPPAITTVDAALSGTGKVLYAQSTTSVIWKDAFDVPFPAAASKVLQVSSLGVPAWVSPPDYAPAYPTDDPKYLSVGSSAKAWRVVSQMPTLSKGTVGDTLQFQYDDKWAWKSIRWLSDVPGNKKYLHNVTGTGTDGAVSSLTTTLYAAAKSTYIQEGNTDANAGGHHRISGNGQTGQAKIPLIEFDLSSLSADDYSNDNLVSVQLKLYIVSHSSSNRDFVVKRVKNTFVQGTGYAGGGFADDGVTWLKPTAPGGSPDWNWGGGTFDPDKELDHELPVYAFAVGGASGGTTTSAFNYIDIKDLFLDALRNRSGVLRIAIYDPNPTGSSKYFNAFTNLGHANDLKLQVVHATERTAYWQPWNYSHVRSAFAGGGIGNDPDEVNWRLGGPGGQRWSTNPHLFAEAPTTTSYAIKGGHTVAGKMFPCSYSYANHANLLSQISTVHPVACIHDDKVKHYLDITSQETQVSNGADGNVAQPDAQNLRTSIIWLADE